MAQRPLRSTKRETASIPVSELERYGRAWLMDSEIRQHTHDTQTNRKLFVKNLLWFCRRKGLTELGTLEARAFIAYVTNGHQEPGGRWGNPHETQPVKARTVKDYYCNLRTLLRWIVEEGGLDACPLDGIKPPIVRRDQIQPFSEAQVNALLAAARQSAEPERNEAILLLMFDSGIRAMEVCGLTVGDIDVIGKRACVLGKGNKRRTVPFGSRTARALRQYLRTRGETQEDAPLFTSVHGRTTGERITESGLLQLFERLGKMAKIGAVRCSPHTMRHTFAVTFLRRGGSPFTLQMLMGHEDLAMSRRYSALAQADAEQQHRQFSPVDNLGKRAKK